MGQVVVESQVVVYDAVVDVIRFEQVLQRPRLLLRLGLDLMRLDFRQLDAAGATGPAAEVGQGWEFELEHVRCEHCVRYERFLGGNTVSTCSDVVEIWFDV